MTHDVPTCWFVSGRDQGDELLPPLHGDSGRSEIKSRAKLYRRLCSSAPARRWPPKEEVVTEASRNKTSPDIARRWPSAPQPRHPQTTQPCSNVVPDLEAICARACRRARPQSLHFDQKESICGVT